MSELPPDAPHALAAIPRDAVADTADAPQLLDVDVHHSCPGRSHSYRRPTGAASTAGRRARPSWANVRATVARLSPTASAMIAPVHQR